VHDGRGDTGGYHLSVGLERQKYVLRPLATIQPNGYAGDDWLGYQCVTGDRRHVVVTLAPRWAVNRPELRDRGALVYVVDVPSGRVRPAVKGVAFKYHAVGCGTGGKVALLRHLGHDQARSELLVLDTATARTRLVATVPGHLTSPIPDDHGVLALQGRSIVRLPLWASPARKVGRVASMAGEPYRLTAAAKGEADLLVLGDGSSVELQRLSGRTLRRVGSGRAGEVQLFGGAAGRNVVLGLPDAVRAPSGMRAAQRPRPVAGGQNHHADETAVPSAGAVGQRGGQGYFLPQPTTRRATRIRMPTRSPRQRSACSAQQTVSCCATNRPSNRNYPLCEHYRLASAVRRLRCVVPQPIRWYPSAQSRETSRAARRTVL
jgi:hypothetical protein